MVWRDELQTMGYVAPEWPRDLLKLTPGDVVAMIAQQLEVTGTTPDLDATTRPEALAAAADLLAALGRR